MRSFSVQETWRGHIGGDLQVFPPFLHHMEDRLAAVGFIKRCFLKDEAPFFYWTWMIKYNDCELFTNWILLSSRPFLGIYLQKKKKLKKRKKKSDCLVEATNNCLDHACTFIHELNKIMKTYGKWIIVEPKSKCQGHNRPFWYCYFEVKVVFLGNTELSKRIWLAWWGEKQIWEKKNQYIIVFIMEPNISLQFSS